jgi:hypothetical protein
VLQTKLGGREKRIELDALTIVRQQRTIDQLELAFAVSDQPLPDPSRFALPLLIWLHRCRRWGAAPARFMDSIDGQELVSTILPYTQKCNRWAR